jgi:hypothetical protein
MSFQHEVLEWYESNQQKFEGSRISNDLLADIYIRDHPGCTYSWETVKKYITWARAGKIRPPNKVDIDQIMTNVKTANEAFRPTIVADLDPLRLNLDMNKVFFDVPETFATHLEPLTITGVNHIGIGSDFHFPLHNRKAVLAWADKLKSLEVDGIYLNGDIMDCAAVGHHDKRKILNYTWDQELAVTRAFLKSLRVLFPDIPIWYKAGNHEDWLPRYLAKVAPQLGNEYGLAQALGLADLNITYIESSRVVRYGSLWIVHGHEVGLKGGGVNIARALLLRTNVNILAGHWHKNDQHERRNLDESVVSAWVTGCLSDLHPDYAPNNQMTHGFATVELTDDKGGFTVHPYKIIHGRVVG